MKRTLQSSVCSGCGLLLAAGLWACPAGEVEEKPAAATAGRLGAGGAAVRVVPGSTEPVSVTPASQRPKAPLASPPWRIPVGPSLPILPGKGVGPIRFGARLETIERLIGEPCEEKREQADGVVVCRFSAHAAEFLLRDGVLKEIRAHRLGRPFKPETKLDFGIYNGRFEAGAAFGMLERGVQEFLGKPKAVRKVEKPEAENPNRTVEVHEYDGFTLEYDQLSPERVVLGGVVLKAPE